MTKQDIIEKLQDGWDLANRGKGWWLSAPRVAYKRTESYEIEESTIKAMKAEGILEFDLPYTTLWARLVKPTSEENLDD
jgi:hypothetical protein